MKILERTKEEIAQKVETMSDFLKMEYLENCLKQFPDREIQKFCYFRLSQLYEGRKMFVEAARNMTRYANLLDRDKNMIKAHLKEAELWIKAGSYDDVDAIIKKIVPMANAVDKIEIKSTIKEAYSKQAIEFEKGGKNSYATKIYERMLADANETERIAIQKRLVELYRRLGKVREYLALKGALEQKGIKF
jgi:hypothetical protein